jgi:O-antigen/teichoic acid export membrane protein
LSNLFNIISGFLILKYTAIYLGALAYGDLSFAQSSAIFVAIFGDLGLQQLAVREIARNKTKANEYFINIISIKIILIIAMIFFFYSLLIINPFRYSKESIILISIFVISQVLGSLTNTNNAIFQAFEKMNLMSVATIINCFFMLFGTIILIKTNGNIYGFAFLYLFASLLIFIYSYLNVTIKFVKINYREVSYNFSKRIISDALPFGLTAILLTIYNYSDLYLLSFLKGNYDVGLFNAPYSMVIALMAIPNIIGIAIFPYMSISFVSSDISFGKIYERYLKYMLILGIPIGIIITLLSDQIIFIIFGSGYAASSMILKLLIWRLVFVFADSSIIKLFESSNKPIIVTKLFGICTILKFPLDIIFISMYGYLGAALVSAVTEFIYLAFLFIYTYKIGQGMEINFIKNILFKLILANAAIIAIVFLIKDWFIFYIILVSIIGYFVISLIIKLIDSEDISILKQAMISPMIEILIHR